MQVNYSWMTAHVYVHMLTALRTHAYIPHTLGSTLQFASIVSNGDTQTTAQMESTSICACTHCIYVRIVRPLDASLVIVFKKLCGKLI